MPEMGTFGFGYAGSIIAALASAEKGGAFGGLGDFLLIICPTSASKGDYPLDPELLSEPGNYSMI